MSYYRANYASGRVLRARFYAGAQPLGEIITQGFQEEFLGRVNGVGGVSIGYGIEVEPPANATLLRFWPVDDPEFYSEVAAFRTATARDIAPILSALALAPPPPLIFTAAPESPTQCTGTIIVRRADGTPVTEATKVVLELLTAPVNTDGISDIYLATLTRMTNSVGVLSLALLRGAVYRITVRNSSTEFSTGLGPNFTVPDFRAA